jgi:cytochrome c peroxidase
MPLFNLAWKSHFFWDGRTPTLRQQVLQPIEDVNEMHETLPSVIAKLKADRSYPKEFADAFAEPTINDETIAKALEQYLLTLVSHDTKFDRSIRGETQLSDQEKRGFEMFFTEFDPLRGQRGADCFHCHGGALFTDHQFHNNGLDVLPSDTGRERITGEARDHGKFVTPSLRNVALTAPYMHDGRFKTLDEVVEHYDHGVQRSETLDPNIAKHPVSGMALTAEEKAALVAFLKTLSDPLFGGPPIVSSR